MCAEREDTQSFRLPFIPVEKHTSLLMKMSRLPPRPNGCLRRWQKPLVLQNHHCRLRGGDGDYSRGTAESNAHEPCWKYAAQGNDKAAIEAALLVENAERC